MVEPLGVPSASNLEAVHVLKAIGEIFDDFYHFVYPFPGWHKFASLRGFNSLSFSYDEVTNIESACFDILIIMSSHASLVLGEPKD